MFLIFHLNSWFRILNIKTIKSLLTLYFVIQENWCLWFEYITRRSSSEVSGGRNYTHNEQYLLIRNYLEIYIVWNFVVQCQFYFYTTFFRIRLFPHFIEPKECTWIYEQLYQELPWRQRSDVKNGETYLQPRLTAWYGDHGYAYSGVKHEANVHVSMKI